MGDAASPFPAIHPAGDISNRRQRSKLDLIQQLNQQHASQRPEDDKLAARISSLELAYRMQAAAPEAVDLSRETAETRKLYGLDHEDTAANGRNCLLARRLVERGVRCVQLYMGAGSRWDAHTDVEDNHSTYCKESDQPIAALITDLKRRGLLDSTLVIWGGEFGRTPMSESGAGRDQTRSASPCSWPAAVSNRASSMVPLTISVCMPSRARRMSTTFTPRSSICSGSITRSLLGFTMAAMSG
jgi:membrane-anchored protein YejM (alkaline phosphatase superfamily)